MNSRKKRKNKDRRSDRERLFDLTLTRMLPAKGRRRIEDNWKTITPDQIRKSIAWCQKFRRYEIRRIMPEDSVRFRAESSCKMQDD
jgi:hypothetical protein